MKYVSEVELEIMGDLEPPFETNVEVKVVK